MYPPSQPPNGPVPNGPVPPGPVPGSGGPNLPGTPHQGPGPDDRFPDGAGVPAPNPYPPIPPHAYSGPPPTGPFPPPPFPPSGTPPRTASAAALIGPIIAALTGAYLATFTFGQSGDAIAADLGYSDGQLLWMFLGYLIPLAIGVPVGLTLRRFPAAVFGIGIVAMLIGVILESLVFGPLLLVARVLAGLGAGAVWGAVVGLAWLDARSKPALGVLAGLAVVSMLSGLVAGGAIVMGLSWRIAWLTSALPLLAALVISLAMSRGLAASAKNRT